MKAEIATTKEELLKAAEQRWLYPQEILTMLNSFEAIGFFEELCSPPVAPVNGQLFFYDRRVVKNYKLDGVSWVVRKGSDRVQETYQSLKIEGTERLLGMYSRCATMPTFRRRIYRTSDTNDPRADKLIIHYRDYPEGEASQRAAVKPKAVKKPRPKQAAINVGGLGLGMGIGGMQSDASMMMFLQQHHMQQQQQQQHMQQQQLLQYQLQQQQSAALSMDYIGDDDDCDGYDEDGDGDEDNALYGLDEEVRQELLWLMDTPPSPNSDAAASTAPVFDHGLNPYQYQQQQQQQQQHKQRSSSVGAAGQGQFVRAAPPAPAPAQKKASTSTAVAKASTATAAATQPSPSGLATIVDFAPATGPVSGGTKVLVVLSQALPAAVLKAGTALQVSFGSAGVRAEAVAPNVLRCISPPAPSSVASAVAAAGSSQVLVPVSLCVGTYVGEPLSVWSTTGFGYTFEVPVTATATTAAAVAITASAAATATAAAMDATVGNQGQVAVFGSEQTDCGVLRKRSNVEASHSFAPAPVSASVSSVGAGASSFVASGQSSASSSSPRNGSHDQSGQSGLSTGPAQSSTAFDPGTYAEPSEAQREHKIRIVERLGTVRSALLPSDFAAGTDHLEGNNEGGTVMDWTGSPPGPGQGQAFFGKDWLDDCELSRLSTTELEALLEAYQLSVVTELVRQVALDDEVRTELDALDAGGFCLLHYCCLYNLRALVHPLLVKGASINQRSAAGSTALHLAVTSGHIDVTETMLQHGADCGLLDAAGMSAFELAARAGESRLVSLLRGPSEAAGVRLPSELNDHDTNLGGRNSSLTPCLFSAPANAATAVASAASAAVPAPASDSAGFSLKSTATAGVGGVSSEPLSTAPPVALAGTQVESSSQTFLLETFNNLSLADKCALSLSLSLSQSQSLSQQSLSPTDLLSQPHTRQGPQSVSPKAMAAMEGMGIQKVTSMASFDGFTLGLDAVFDSNDGSSLDGSHSQSWQGGEVDLEAEIKSVISESDQVSLVQAMAMMAPAELSQLGAEVRSFLDYRLSLFDCTHPSTHSSFPLFPTPCFFALAPTGSPHTG